MVEKVYIGLPVRIHSSSFACGNFVYITKNPPCPEGIAKRSDLVLSGETGGLNDRDGETPADGIEHKMEQVELDQVEVCK